MSNVFVSAVNQLFHVVGAKNDLKSHSGSGSIGELKMMPSQFARAKRSPTPQSDSSQTFKGIKSMNDMDVPGFLR